MHQISAYGLWSLVILNSLVFIIFAFSFTKPKSPRDWRSFGAFSAFIVALFTEMYGFPMTIYLLSGWMQTRFPKLDLMSHDAGHLWYTILGFTGNPHSNPIHILSNVLTLAGFVLLASAWKVLYQAQRSHTLAVTGPYSVIRHPQYVAFITIMFSFLLQWPTILTLLMFPVLVWMYAGLAKREEQEAVVEFGDEYRRYAAQTPSFFPHLALKAT
jgi:protein-S-isoprenylcysteine O-methyltransferase Ste14